MTIGDGLLWSTILILVFATVWLASKHRAWKRIGKVAAVIGAICVLIAVAIWGWATYSNQPTRMEALAGVEIGMSLGEVQVKKGPPTQTRDLKDERITALIYSASYSDDELVVALKGTADKRSVFRICQAGTFYALGLSEYANEDQIRGRLGESSSSRILEGNLTKRLMFERFNVWFDIEKDKVARICVGLDD